MFFIAPQIHAQTLVAPTGLTAVADATGVMSWTAPSDDSQILAYGVTKCTAPCTDSFLSFVKQVPDPGILGNAPTTYLDTAVTAGTTYRYGVFAFYTAGRTVGPTSSSITVTVPLPAPTGLMAEEDASGVTLSWTAPSDASEIIAYGVYAINLSVYNCILPCSSIDNVHIRCLGAAGRGITRQCANHILPEYVSSQYRLPFCGERLLHRESE